MYALLVQMDWSWAVQVEARGWIPFNEEAAIGPALAGISRLELDLWLAGLKTQAIHHGHLYKVSHLWGLA